MPTEKRADGDPRQIWLLQPLARKIATQNASHKKSAEKYLKIVENKHTLDHYLAPG